MNTLPRATTTHIFAEPGRYDALRRHWHALVTSHRRHELTAAHHLLYAALRGRDWRRGFTPIRRPSKLAGGAFAGWALFDALWQLQSVHRESQLLAPFDGLVTPTMLAELRPLLPSVQQHRLDPTNVAARGLPFDAYVSPEEAPRG
jgi:hypothetical protein